MRAQFLPSLFSKTLYKSVLYQYYQTAVLYFSDICYYFVIHDNIFIVNCYILEEYENTKLTTSKD